MNNFSDMDMSDYQNALAQQSNELDRKYNVLAQRRAEAEQEAEKNNIITGITEPLGAEFIKKGLENTTNYIKGGIRKGISRGVKSTAQKLGVPEEDVNTLLKGDRNRVKNLLQKRSQKLRDALKKRKPIQTAEEQFKGEPQVSKPPITNNRLPTNPEDYPEPTLSSAFDVDDPYKSPIQQALEFYKKTATEDPKTLLDDDDDDTDLPLQQPKSINQEGGLLQSDKTEEQKASENFQKEEKEVPKSKPRGNLDEDDLNDLEDADLFADTGAEDEGFLNPIADLIALGLGISTAVEGAEASSVKEPVGDVPKVSSASVQFGT